ncbi:osteocalcin isoform X1 [Gorilla gorilla gorilla]|uniref:Polyamine modulated factor 1 n=1 Tax=Gorilla gorilla gorilla TaxID=9595 RepID=G3R5R0_GORGO|nr:osteocalcin isoform X1 [Gorilla gorilla gorilla]
MAEASSANLGSGCEEKRHEGSSPESVPPGTTISRVKLLDTMVDTFLQKLVAAGSSPLLHWDGSAGSRLPSGGQSVKQAFSWAACRLPQGRKEEISDIKEEGNLEAVLNALDKIVEEGKVRKEPAWRPSGIPEKDLHSVMAPYFLQQRDTLQRHVQKQEAENQQLADAVLAGRREVEELQLQVQARQQAWQALHREQRELVAVLREPE